jgi:hypothetical protein
MNSTAIIVFVSRARDYATPLCFLALPLRCVNRDAKTFTCGIVNNWQMRRERYRLRILYATFAKGANIRP